MATLDPWIIHKLLRRWTHLIWFARGAATLSCVVFAWEIVSRRNWWAGGFQLICLSININTILFCLKQRRILEKIQCHYLK